MSVLPVVERELRVASRRRGTYWSRCAGAAAAVGMVSAVLLATLQERADERSQTLFVAVSVVAFVYCLISGVLTTSDCVSEEKREGTLGLLFLTDLRGYEVVSGKMVVGSIRALGILAAMIPVMGLPLMMGGVPGEAVLRMSLILFNTMFLSLTLGVFLSVISRDARQAVGLSVTALLALLVALPLLRWVVVEYVLRPSSGMASSSLTQWFGSLDRPLDWVFLLNPALLLFSGIQSSFGGGPRAFQGFWAALGAQHALAWGCLVSAFVLLPRRWQEGGERRFDIEGRWVKDQETTSSPWRRWRGEVLEKHPFAWMIVRERRSWTVTWLGLGAIGAGWVWGFWEVREDWLAGFVALATIFVAGVWLKVRLAAMACRHLHEHCRTGAMELILCTPLRPAALVRDHLAGLVQMLGPPLAVVLAAAGLLLTAALRQDIGRSDGEEFLAAFGAGVLVLLADVWALAWTGMWQGARSRRYVRAYAWTLGLVLGLPYLVLVASLILAGAFFQVVGLGPTFDPDAMALIVGWAVVSLVVDGVLVVLARRGLPAILLRQPDADLGTRVDAVVARAAGEGGGSPGSARAGP